MKTTIIKSFFGAFLFLGIANCAFSADAEVKLTTNNGSTKMIVQDSDAVTVFSADSNGNTVINGTATVAGSKFSVGVIGVNGFIVDTGSVGIGTASPGAKLEVAGQVKITGGSPGSGKVLTSDANGLASWVSAEVIPAGAVMFFNLSSCPSGWSELTAARGRYIVGLLSGGTLAGTVGNAFTTDLENRPVGQHNHTITDPGHSHVIPNDNAGGNSNTAVEGSLQGGTMSTDVNTTGISANNSGSVAGTNAPYIQLRVCQKS